MNMKAKSESLGSGFYLSIILLLMVLAIWQVLGPRQADREYLSRFMNGTISQRDYALQKSPSYLIPSRESSQKEFSKSLRKLAAESANANEEKILFNSLINCSLQIERSLDQRFMCAQMAYKINRSHSNEYRRELGSAQ